MTYPQNQYQQGGYQQGGYQNQQGGQGGGQPNQQNSGFDNHVKIQVIGRLTKDPESKMVNNSKVATSKIAVNHRGQNADADFWFVEIWGNEGADSKHNFLVNHCPKGRRVFIEGTPMLKQQKAQDGSYNYYPTIKVTEIIGLDGGNQQGGGQQGGGQQQYNQPPQGQYAPPQQQYNQAPPQQQYQAPPQQGYAPPAPPQGGYQAPPAPQGGFPPNPPGGYAPVGAPVGAPNGGGFPPAPPQQ